MFAFTYFCSADNTFFTAHAPTYLSLLRPTSCLQQFSQQACTWIQLAVHPVVFAFVWVSAHWRTTSVDWGRLGSVWYPSTAVLCWWSTVVLWPSPVQNYHPIYSAQLHDKHLPKGSYRRVRFPRHSFLPVVNSMVDALGMINDCKLLWNFHAQKHLFRLEISW